MKDLKPKKVKGRIKVLRALPYKGSMVYLRMINKDIFMYDLIFNNEIYSSYMVFTPRNGQTKLSKSEIESAASLIWAGAMATIDTLLGETVTGEKKEQAERFIGRDS